MKTTKKLAGFLALLCTLFLFSATPKKAPPCSYTIFNNTGCDATVDIDIQMVPGCNICANIARQVIMNGATYTIPVSGNCCTNLCNIVVSVIDLGGPVSPPAIADFTHNGAGSSSCLSPFTIIYNPSSQAFTIQ